MCPERTHNLMARPDGFEPPTTAFEAQCSIQLSYGRLPGGHCKRLTLRRAGYSR
jgi:hypothetical protein